MKTAGISQKILFLLEIIISLRILLFTVPVFVSEWTNASSSASSDDRSVLTFTVFALVYLFTGAVSLFKISLAKVLHYFSLVVVLACVFLNKPFQVMPSGILAVTALVLALLATFLKSTQPGESK